MNCRYNVQNASERLVRLRVKCNDKGFLFSQQFKASYSATHRGGWSVAQQPFTLRRVEFCLHVIDRLVYTSGYIRL